MMDINIQRVKRIVRWGVMLLVPKVQRFPSRPKELRGDVLGASFNSAECSFRLFIHTKLLTSVHYCIFAMVTLSNLVSDAFA
jgi:hypothetical protein